MEDIRENGRILASATQMVSRNAVKGGLFPANSIIVATSATIGEHALITVPSLANQRFMYNLCSPFLYFFQLPKIYHQKPFSVFYPDNQQYRIAVLRYNGVRCAKTVPAPYNIRIEHCIEDIRKLVTF